MKDCTISQEEIAILYHQGKLSIAENQLYAAFLEMNQDARDEIAFYDFLSGEFIQETPQIELSDDALERALARIERPISENTYEKKENTKLPEFLKGFDIPNSIARLEFQNRYWAAPGVWIAKTRPNGIDNSVSYLMYAKKGLQMPEHDHGGREMTLVLQGSLKDANSAAQIGEIMIADCDYNHSPMIGEEIDCLCFICANSPIIPTNLLGKILQPFAKI
jgi:putative transcriptional regulator